ncbi:MAG: class II fructose-bisphosphate aldolase [Firmicutes bacterium]|nr:class II fructose-bisphosphate aldolase [Bacillota bacterium]
MMLTTSRDMLLKAQAGGYAVGAFNVENMEMVQAVVAAAEELQSPVMLQTTSSTLKYASPELYFANAKAAAEAASVPVCIHLDHGKDFDISMKCLRAGYTSIMIDGSHEEYEDNIRVTKEVADVCKAMGIPCEGELGKVGGKEDDVEAEGDAYTDPLEAKEFVERTGVTSLAVGIGTAHGVYKTTPVLNVERLSEIRAQVDVPLVLHGASGLSDEAVQECIRRGICKVNFATELRQAYTGAVQKLLIEKPETFDPKAYGKEGRAAVKALVEERMKVCGSVGKA